MERKIDPRVTADLTKRKNVGNKTAAVFVERRERADRKSIKRILKRKDAVPPRPGDERT